jgi:hypothetical protein
MVLQALRKAGILTIVSLSILFSMPKHFPFTSRISFSLINMALAHHFSEDSKAAFLLETDLTSEDELEEHFPKSESIRSVKFWWLPLTAVAAFGAGYILRSPVSTNCLQETFWKPTELGEVSHLSANGTVLSG